MISVWQQVLFRRKNIFSMVCIKLLTFALGFLVYGK